MKWYECVQLFLLLVDQSFLSGGGKVLCLHNSWSHDLLLGGRRAPGGGRGGLRRRKVDRGRGGEKSPARSYGL